jgi:DNA gyrase subunit A
MSDLAKEIIPINIEDELRNSYLDYAMSVIVGRALPDVRDGLKPVHRRVLFAMHELSNDWNKPYKKSARVVGDVIGKYHPHGDVAVYDTIVRMAQDFSMRYTLVDGQGNFGSVDGDSAAAMRYTEIRMDRIAHELLADLEKETVAYVQD